MKDNQKPSDETKAEELKETTEAIEEAVQDKPEREIQGIAICGSHPETIERAPFDDPSWLIYACSPHNVEHRTLPRVDEWFEVHLPIQDATRSYHYLRTLEHLGHRVWMRKTPMPEGEPQSKAEQREFAQQAEARRLDELNMAWFKEAREYPFDNLSEVFGPFFWTGSIAHIIYKAIVDCCGDETFRLFYDMRAVEAGKLEVPDYVAEAAKRPAPIPQIALHGILQMGREEYEQQRWSTQYAMWRAHTAGIGVQVARESQLLEPARFMF